VTLEGVEWRRSDDTNAVMNGRLGIRKRTCLFRVQIVLTKTQTCWNQSAATCRSLSLRACDKVLGIFICDAKLSAAAFETRSGRRPTVIHESPAPSAEVEMPTQLF
jgi:hypothetical protein